MDSDDLPGEKLRCGSLVINLCTNNVLVMGNEVSLSPLQFKVILYLARNQNRRVSPEELLKQVWENPYGTHDQVRGVVKRIRKKLDAVEKGYRKYIRTKRGWGYQLVPLQETTNDTKATTNRHLHDI